MPLIKPLNWKYKNKTKGQLYFRAYLLVPKQKTKNKKQKSTIPVISCEACPGTCLMSLLLKPQSAADLIAPRKKKEKRKNADACLKQSINDDDDYGDDEAA